MTKIILSIFFYFLSISSFSQNPIKENSHSISSIAADNEDYSDLQFLKKTLAGKRVVMLGEQMHGDGATFKAKVRLVKFLHKEMGFDVLAFEGEMYGINKANEEIRSGVDAVKPFRDAVFDIWSDAEEFRPLIKYIQANIYKPNTLEIAGFDVQTYSHYAQEDLVPELQVFLNNNLNKQLAEDFFVPVYQLLAELKDGDFKNYSAEDSLEAIKTIKQLSKALVALKTKPGSADKAGFYERILKNMLDEMHDAIKNKKATDIANDPRDKAMAGNLLYLVNEQYAGKKIICWGASYHFSKGFGTVEPCNDTTLKYIDKIKIDQQINDYDVTELKYFKPMGQIVSDSLKDELYSLAFTCYEGNYATVIDPKVKPVYTPPIGSIEEDFYKQGNDFAFADFSKNAIPDEKFFSMLEGYVPIKANWNKAYDGIFYTKKMFPAHQFQDTIFNETLPGVVADSLSLQKARLVLKGTTLNKNTKETIPFVDISIRGKSVRTASNEAGLYILKLTPTNSTDTICFSAMGFETRLIAVNRVPAQIELKPAAYSLKEVTVRAKLLNPKQIVKKAIKAIETNYAQSAYSMDIFYRFKSWAKDSLTMQEEAALDLYNKDGDYKTSWRSSSDKLFLNLNQYNQIKGNKPKKDYNPLSLIWVIFAHNFVLTSDNAFAKMRMFGYTYKLDDIVEYDGNDVYKISFVCDKKSGYFTGWGSVDSLSGTLYINQKDFALVKYDYYKAKTFENTWGFDTVGIVNTVSQTYQYYKGKYYLSYVKNTTFEKNKDRIKGWFNYKNEEIILGNNIEQENPKILKKNILDYSADVPYNKQFWDNFNVIFDK